MHDRRLDLIRVAYLALDLDVLALDLDVLALDLDVD